MRVFVGSALLLAAVASAASAQEQVSSHRTALSAVGGLSVGSSHGFGFSVRGLGFGARDGGADAAVGGSLAHELTPRMTLEAGGLFLDRNASAWSADAGVRLNLQPSGKSTVPYFAAGAGVYSEHSRGAEALLRGRTFDVPELRVALPVRGGDRRFPAGVMPTRVTAEVASDARLDGGRRTDAMLSMGGGVVFAAGPRVFVRPDVRAQMVFSDDTRVYGLFTLSFGYRF